MDMNNLLKVDDAVKVSRASPKPSLEGIVAYLGPVKFGDRGSDWVGIRLTGSSIGSGKNDGVIQGHRYFRCPKQCGIFVRKNKVKKKKRGSKEKQKKWKRE